MTLQQATDGGRRPGYGSDLVVDILHQQEVPFLAINPGASFRGLHDSLVNYGEGDPEIILVPHEKVAVGIAHGYAKATGRMMGVVLHDLVGLLHGTMGVYYAYTDRVPMLVLGGSGPMDAARRRPWIDWIHTANLQNTAIREYTKWDDHPHSVAAVPDSLARAHRVATIHPQGPVYVSLDADLQEEPLTEPLAPTALVAPTRLAPDPAALTSLAAELCAAERPMIVAGAVGRDPDMWHVLVELAELLGAGVVDTNIRNNFPSHHPLNVTGSGELAGADVILLLDVKDIGQHTQLLTKEIRGDRLPEVGGPKILDIGFGDLGISSWSADYGSLFHADLSLVADTSVALPALKDLCAEVLRAEQDSEHRAERRRVLGAVHDRTRAAWVDKAREHVEGEPMSTARLVLEVGEALEDYDWVLTAGTGNGWATRLWKLDEPYRHPGRSLGTATQIGISLGVALAHRDSDRLVVDLQPDGDLMFDAGALWVAAHHRIPLLVIMVNNRAYNNDWVHQKVIAGERGSPQENAAIGITIDDPAPDFAKLAESMGWYARGPVTRPEDIGPAVAEAVSVMTSTGVPALLDVVCRPDS